jgi:hypothetical protein
MDRLYRSATWAAGALALILAGCSSTPQVGNRAIPNPPEPGLYALSTNDSLTRLDGSPEWEVRTWSLRADLSPETLLVIEHPALARGRGTLNSPAVQLRRVAWLRSEINAEGAVMPAAERNWVDTDLDQLARPVQIHWISAYENTIVMRPQQPLEPGLYTLHFGETDPPLRARFGVGWSRLDQQHYAGNNCVDRYVGAEQEYRACTDQSVDVSIVPLRKLRVQLVSAERQTVGGEPALVVKGTVANTGSESAQVPQLLARMLDKDGRIIGQWLFPADKSTLRAGESTTFRTDIKKPTPALAHVGVELAVPELRWRRAETRQ